MLDNSEPARLLYEERSTFNNGRDWQASLKLVGGEPHVASCRVCLGKAVMMYTVQESSRYIRQRIHRIVAKDDTGAVKECKQILFPQRTP
jgi:hypothetical protein